MDNTQRHFQVVNGLPANIPGVIGGHHPKLLRTLDAYIPQFPPLDPASNFTRFLPPNATDTPENFFVPGFTRASIPAPRFTRQSNLSEFLIYTDGACSENGSQAARGGCAFVYRPETSPSSIPAITPSGHSTDPMELHKLGASSFRLESRGPTGEAATQTSNRAELRAVIGALGFRMWHNEGWQRLVIATDSSYVVDGATEWIKRWQQNGWQTSTRKRVKNQDLWKELIRHLERWSGAGVAVLFWLIPRELNTVADRFAKEAAALADVEGWTEINGVLC
jgi:ribonuclease HI